MSEQQILSQISELEDDITRVEEEAAKKDASAEKEIEADWDDNINTTKSKLDVAEVDLKEATEKSSEWTKKKNKLTTEVKSLKKEYANLRKGKEKALDKKLTNIEKHKKTEIKRIRLEIAALEKKLEQIQRDKALAEGAESGETRM